MSHTNIPQHFYRTSAKALILNDQKEFLLCKEENGIWELPGGGIQFGEEVTECIQREILEEMGLQVTSVATTCSYFTTCEHTKGFWVANALFVTTVADYNFTPSDECIEIGWFTKESAKTVETYNNVEKFLAVFDPSNH